MGFLNSIFAIIFTFVCVSSISLFVSLSTIKGTVLDRDHVKAWARDSGVYNDALDAVLATDVTNGGENLITRDIFKQALIEQFPTTYVQEHTEVVIDSTYDWLDGRASSIEFSIPVDEKREALIANVARLIEPGIAVLPRCGNGTATFNSNTITCRPDGVSNSAYASQLATSAINQNKILAKPITNDDIKPGFEADFRMVQVATSNLTLLITVVLPILAAAAGVIRVLVAMPGQKLRALEGLGGHIFISSTLSLIIGLVAMFFGGNIQLASAINSADMTQVEITDKIIDPILQQSVPSIGATLSLISLAVMGLGVLLWVLPKVYVGIMTRRRLLVPDIDSQPKDNTPVPTYPGQNPQQNSNPESNKTKASSSSNSSSSSWKSSSNSSSDSNSSDSGAQQSSDIPTEPLTQPPELEQEPEPEPLATLTPTEESDQPVAEPTPAADQPLGTPPSEPTPAASEQAPAPFAVPQEPSVPSQPQSTPTQTPDQPDSNNQSESKNNSSQ